MNYKKCVCVCELFGVKQYWLHYGISVVDYKKCEGAFWCETILTTLWHFLLLAVKWMWSRTPNSLRCLLSLECPWGGGSPRACAAQIKYKHKYKYKYICKYKYIYKCLFRLDYPWAGGKNTDYANETEKGFCWNLGSCWISCQRFDANEILSQAMQYNQPQYNVICEWCNVQVFWLHSSFRCHTLSKFHIQ